MEFLFQISAYEEPGLEEEAAELLRQRLEARSRQAVPGMWRVTDGLNARKKVSSAVQARRRKRYRVYGVLLLGMGVLILAVGLMEPRTPNLVGAGIFAILCGILEFRLARGRQPSRPPASCRKEAAELLRARRETDWKRLQAEIRFDENGWTVATAEGGSRTLYSKLRDVFETEHLWMLIDQDDMALLLQKKDLVLGRAEEFLPCLQEKRIK